MAKGTFKNYGGKFVRVKASFKQVVHALEKLISNYDASTSEQIINLLQTNRNCTWKSGEYLMRYVNLLLFFITYPKNSQITNQIESEWKRLTLILGREQKKEALLYQDTGLPYSKMITRFSHDLISWLKEEKNCKLELDSFDAEGVSLNKLLYLTLPAYEKDITSIGYTNEELLDILGIKRKLQLSFLLSQFSTLNQTPYMKDHVWESLKLFISISFKHPSYSIFYNRLPTKKPFIQESLLKRFDALELIHNPLPKANKLKSEERSSLVACIKKSLLLTMRETDPSTYMNENNLELYTLERGIQVAIYGMSGERQLPYRSYIGYTLFKNGYPVAYGGSWIFGRTAIFGLNIFEAFRGGESGYIMCQLLRVYQQAFQLDSIQIEPYQFGLDNPDGITSGAFWFYYKYGFRPRSKKLQQLALFEQNKLTHNRNYRTSERTLLRFTESSLELQIGDKKSIDYNDFVNHISAFVRKKYKGDYIHARTDCLHNFIKKAKIPYSKSINNKVLEDMAFWAAAYQIDAPHKIAILTKMLSIKSKNPIAYNSMVKEMLD